LSDAEAADYGECVSCNVMFFYIHCI